MMVVHGLATQHTTLRVRCASLFACPKAFIEYRVRPWSLKTAGVEHSGASQHVSKADVATSHHHHHHHLVTGQ
jgi:hypothetical protein